MNSMHDATRISLRMKPLAACLLGSLVLSGLPCGQAGAAMLQVTNCNDAGGGSLRATVASANSGDTVDLRSLACERIPLTSGTLVITANDLVLQGPGSARLTVSVESDVHQTVFRHQGTGTFRVDSLRITRKLASYFSEILDCINSVGTLSLNESIVTGCRYGGATTSAGLIMRNSTVSDNDFGVSVGAGAVSIIGSTISGNQSYPIRIGGTSNGGAALIQNTTISGNRLWVGYGSIYNGAAGRILRAVTITNSTIAFNSSDSGGVGGLFVQGSPVVLESTIFSNNSTLDLDVSLNTPISGHSNLMTRGAIFATGENAPVPIDTLSADPLLQPLADNGGLTMTHALGIGSPAIDAGNNLASLPSDQRGSPFARISGAMPDIGAFESQTSASNGSIGPGFTGSWFDPAQSGHGLMLEVLPGNRLLAFWFSFNPEGNQQVWFGGVGTYSGNTANISGVSLPSGGRWLPNFDATKIVVNPWGTLSFTFADCNHGKVDFASTSGYGSGSMDLTRLTLPAGLSCP